jgi:hypothetical protein
MWPGVWAGGWRPVKRAVHPPRRRSEGSPRTRHTQGQAATGTDGTAGRRASERTRRTRCPGHSRSDGQAGIRHTGPPSQGSAGPPAQSALGSSAVRSAAGRDAADGVIGATEPSAGKWHPRQRTHDLQRHHEHDEQAGDGEDESRDQPLDPTERHRGQPAQDDRARRGARAIGARYGDLRAWPGKATACSAAALTGRAGAESGQRRGIRAARRIGRGRVGRTRRRTDRRRRFDGLRGRTRAR